MILFLIISSKMRISLILIPMRVLIILIIYKIINAVKTKAIP